MSGTFNCGSFKLSIWLIIKQRLTVKVSVGLNILTFERCSDLGYLGLELWLKYTSNWNTLLASVLRNKVLSPVPTTVNINAKRLFLKYRFGTMNQCRIYCTWRTASEHLRRSVKLALNSFLLMNDDMTKSLYPGPQGHRGRPKHAAPAQSHCKPPLMR